MKCIYCSHSSTSVINSRKVSNGAIVWRRRQCESCHSVFTTREGTFFDNLFVIKRNGKRQRFVYEKLFTSVLVALLFGKDRDNGTQSLQAKSVVYVSLDRLRDKKIKDVSTKDIIRTVYIELLKKHPHAATSYMLYSEYRRSAVKAVMK